mmetsp:Transcript_14621/g.40249  ORF Transcript_14621/g.40249 Transcript_14621/m.40249 type:complete len:279 (-) Transcript_14621:882-1718(-)
MRPIPLLRAPAQPCLLARASSGDGGCCGAGSQTDTKPVDQPRRRLNAAPMVASAAKVVGFDNGGCAPPAYAGLRPRCRGAADIGGHRKDHATGEPPYAYEKGRQGPRGLRGPGFGGRPRAPLAPRPAGTGRGASCGGMRHAGISVGSVGRQRQGGGVAGEEIANEGEETSVAGVRSRDPLPCPRGTAPQGLRLAQPHAGARSAVGRAGELRGPARAGRRRERDQGGGAGAPLVASRSFRAPGRPQRRDRQPRQRREHRRPIGGVLLQSQEHEEGAHDA